MSAIGPVADSQVSGSGAGLADMRQADMVVSYRQQCRRSIANRRLLEPVVRSAITGRQDFA